MVVAYPCLLMSWTEKAKAQIKCELDNERTTDESPAKCGNCKQTPCLQETKETPPDSQDPWNEKWLFAQSEPLEDER